jgi:hypothetical protein
MVLVVWKVVLMLALEAEDLVFGVSLALMEVLLPDGHLLLALLGKGN